MGEQNTENLTNNPLKVQDGESSSFPDCQDTLRKLGLWEQMDLGSNTSFPHLSLCTSYLLFEVDSLCFMQ